MLPNDVILRVDVEVYVMDEKPEGEKFPHMLASDGNVSSDRKHPSILCNSLSHLPVLSPRGLKDERCNVLRLAAKQPGGVLKRRFGPIAHDDGSGGVEKITVLLGARVAQADPELGRLFPFKPKTSEPQSTSKFVGVKNTQTPIAGGAADHVPVDFTFGTGGLVRAGPKKSSLNLVEVVKGTLRDNEWCDGVHSLRGDDRSNKGRAPNGGDVLPIPGDQFSSRLVLEVLEVNFLQSPNREREAQVFDREKRPGRRDTAENAHKIQVGASNGNDRAFVEVGAKARDASKAF